MAKRFNLAELVPEMKVSESDTKRIEMIPISQIRANPKNFYSMNEISALEDSIELNGLLEPLCVFNRDGYMLFSGHRRFRALRNLHEKSNFTKWKEIPCIVYPDPHDEDRETVMLIHANSTGRVLTAYETSQQAKRLKEAFTNMKRNGAELPGKIRDMVAEEMDVSSTKLARLSAIENKLEDCWQESWRQGLLGESVAYEVIRLDSPGQQNLFDWWTTVCGRRISDLKMSDVKGFRERVLGSKPRAAGETECLSCRDCADYLPKNGICARSGNPTAPYDGCSMAHRKEDAALISGSAKSNGDATACGRDTSQSAYGCQTPPPSLSAAPTSLPAGRVFPFQGSQGAGESREGVVNISAMAASNEPPKGAVMCMECKFFSRYDHSCDNPDGMYCGVAVGDYCSRGVKADGTEAEPMPGLEPPAWHKCHAVEPPEGALVALFSDSGWFDAAIYREGQFWYFRDPSISMEVKSSQMWTVLPDLPKE